MNGKILTADLARTDFGSECVQNTAGYFSRISRWFDEILKRTIRLRQGLSDFPPGKHYLILVDLTWP